MNCKEYNEKYADRKKEYLAAIKNWLEENPEKFIAFRTYIPGYNDNGYSTPCIACLGSAPGFVGTHFVSSDGTIYDLDVWDEETEGEDLTDWDRKYLEERKDWDYKKCLEEQDFELGAMLYDGFADFINHWDEDGKISLVDGEIVIDSSSYECGY